VEVDCLDTCAKCAAHSLCARSSQDKGILSVRNPIQACPGDAVLIEVSDTVYNKILIRMFGILLLGGLLGLGAGSLVSAWTSLNSSETGAFGVLLGVLLAGGFFSLNFRHKNREHLYPVITAIVDKGECHGKA